MENNYASSIFINGKNEAITIKAKHSGDIDLWQILQQPIIVGNKNKGKLSKISKIRKEATGNIIEKKNQEYTLNLEYEFIGFFTLQKEFQNKIVNEANLELPLGYRAELPSFEWGELPGKGQYISIFIVILIIYIICSILLESISQPIAVILLIPISFIGIFLSFYVFEINFDQGGFAALLLISGISINSALYIINDFNNLKGKYNFRPSIAIYVKAFNSKIIPITITILSTFLGMSPFLLGPEEPFWFSLAIGVMGGLIFSALGIFICLPIFLIKKTK